MYASTQSLGSISWGPRASPRVWLGVVLKKAIPSVCCLSSFAYLYLQEVAKKQRMISKCSSVAWGPEVAGGITAHDVCQMRPMDVPLAGQAEAWPQMPIAQPSLARVCVRVCFRRKWRCGAFQEPQREKHLQEAFLTPLRCRGASKSHQDAQLLPFHIWTPAQHVMLCVALSLQTTKRRDGGDSHERTRDGVCCAWIHAQVSLDSGT